MATSPSKNSIEEMVTCPICMEWMDQPKHLHCQHAFCAQCLDDWTSQPGQSRRCISCPVCRKKTPIHRGVYKLPPDLGVTRLLDMLKAQKPCVSNALACGLDGLPASAFCSSCSYYLCSDCIDSHIKDENLQQHLLHLQETSCPTHSSAKLEYYCSDCNKEGCMMCMDEMHGYHSFTYIEASASSNRDALQYLQQLLKDAVDKTSNKSGMLTAHMVESKINDLKLQIEAHSRRVGTANEQWLKAMLIDLTSRKEKILQQVSEVESHVKVCDGHLAFSESLLRDASNFILTRAFSATSQRLFKATELLQQLTQKTPKDVGLDFVFVSEPIPESCGKLALQDDLSGTSDQALRSASVSSEGKAKKSPFGSGAEKTRQLPLLCSSSTQTTETGASSGRSDTTSGSASDHSGRPSPVKPIPQHIRNREFDISSWEKEGMRWQKEMHSTEDNATKWSHAARGFLQWTSNKKDEDLEAPITVCIRSGTSDVYVGKTGWFTKGDITKANSTSFFLSKVMQPLSPICLAVSPVDGTIAATEEGSVAFHPSGKVPRPSENDYISRHISTFPTIRLPYGIAITDDNHWIIGDRSHCVIGIYKYTSNNIGLKHVKTFGCEGSETSQFLDPTHICYDSLNNRFIVADTGNNRLQVFSMSTEFQLEITGSLQKPRGLCLDGVGNILVADTGNKQISVFDPYGVSLMRIPLAILPYSLAVDKSQSRRAILVVAGLKGKMPVIETHWFEKETYRRGYSGWGYY